jgi:hypothetical protein
MHPSRPGVLFMQKHWDVMRSDDAGDSWREVSGNLPTDFGFAIDVHAHEPETIYVVPIKSDSEHFPLNGKLRVYRCRSGGNEWESLIGKFRRLLDAYRARPSGRAERGGADPAMIRLELPQHLRTLARVQGEVMLDVPEPVTLRSVLDTLEACYPMLRGTIRDHVTQQRRPLVRFFACREDLSHQSPDLPLPDAVVRTAEPLLIVGAIAGGC